MTVKGILGEYLKEYGYAGFFSLERGNNCICMLDEDFMHCDDDNTNCIAGYKSPCPETGAEDCLFCLTETKPKGAMTSCEECGKLCYIDDIRIFDDMCVCEECYEHAKWIEEERRRNEGKKKKVKMILGEVAEEYLTKHGYDGLFHPDKEKDCICLLSGGIMRCLDEQESTTECTTECIPGYKVPCTEAGITGVQYGFGLSKTKPEGRIRRCEECRKLFYSTDMRRIYKSLFCEDCYESAKWIEEKRRWERNYGTHNPDYHYCW